MKQTTVRMCAVVTHVVTELTGDAEKAEETALEDFYESLRSALGNGFGIEVEAIETITEDTDPADWGYSHEE